MKYCLHLLDLKKQKLRFYVDEKPKLNRENINQTILDNYNESNPIFGNTDINFVHFQKEDFGCICLS